MKRAVVASLAVLSVGTGLVLGGEENCGPRCGPTVSLPNVKFYEKLPPAPPRCLPTVSRPAPTLYHAEVKPPHLAPPVPIPPVSFYVPRPVNVTYYVPKPLPVMLYQAAPCAPAWLPPVPTPQVALYQAEAQAPKCAPTVTIPNVTFYTAAPQSCGTNCK